MAKCSKCGEPLGEGVAFCASCGTAVKAVADGGGSGQRPEEKPAHCTKCGTPLGPGVAFCASCGAPVKAGRRTAAIKERKTGEMTESPFFNFAGPYLDFIGKGKLFSFIYIVMAIMNLVFPIFLVYTTIDSGLFKLGGKYVAAILLAWVFVFFACWVGFQLWWQRRKAIQTIGETQFLATVIFSEIAQTSGEWLGTMIGIIGVGAGLVALLLESEIGMMMRALGLGFANFGAAGIVIAPVTGFFVIIFSRFLAEQIRLLAQLVNNTGEIAGKMK